MTSGVYAHEFRTRSNHPVLEMHGPQPLLMDASAWSTGRTSVTHTGIRPA